MSDIDIVIMWVDGSDPAWLAEKAKYSGTALTGNEITRFRDWDNLRYLFRGIENFMPWVRRIHFVTWGHVPAWLDTDHPKVSVVKHSSFIPSAYLPTFNSRAIELNLHRIKGLSDKFIYFNDDMFILKAMHPKLFFYKDLPTDMAINSRITASKPNDIFNHMLLNNSGVINQHFKLPSVVKRHPYKWVNPFKYGIIDQLKSLSLMPYVNFTGFAQYHMPSTFLKSTFTEVWSKEYEVLDKTCQNRFKGLDGVNQYLIKQWQMCSGNFIPIGLKKLSGYYDVTSNDIYPAVDCIKRQQKNMICLNDSSMVQDFDARKKLLNDAFEVILPTKSGFEN